MCVTSLVEWHLKLRVLSERTWDSVYGKPGHRSAIQRHPNSSSELMLDPNDEFDRSSVLGWLRFADFYQWPHVQQFESWSQLMQLLKEANLTNISTLMSRHNAVEQTHIRGVWRSILTNAQRHRPVKHMATLPTDVNEALTAAYGIKLSSECVGSSPSPRSHFKSKRLL